MTEHYLDNSATTRPSEAALKKYNEVATENFGNPSSLHARGVKAEEELSAARKRILATVGEKNATVVFTGSGSEANNLAILGRAFAKERYRRGAKIITTAGEHASVSSPLTTLSSLGYKTAAIPTKHGIVDIDALEKELTPDVILVTMMMVNNETGALYDVAAVSKRIKAKCPDAILHVDATQSYLKVPFTKAALGADLITVSSHKIHGVKGVGALIVGNDVLKNRGLSPIIFGGGQEGGLRSGTENVPGIAAFGVAAEIGFAALGENAARMNSLREATIRGIAENPALAGISPTLPEAHAPHILNLTLPKIKSETMLHYLSSLGVYVSSGSACSSHGVHGESALVAYGRTAEEADCSIRVSFSEENDEGDVAALLDGLASGIAKLAKMRR